MTEAGERPIQCRGALLVSALAAILLLGAMVPGTAGAAGRNRSIPHIKHLFIVVLENENADDTFGPDAPAYLAQKLPAKGLFMPNYYATGHFSLDNYISMISGQAPNPYTQADCPTYSDFLPGIAAPGGQVIGAGCIYPKQVKTIADQLRARGLRWRGYMEDMAAKAPQEPAACRHPEVGAVDDTQSAEVGDQYATRHNPFMYFHSVIDAVRSCKIHVVDYAKLANDLKRRRKTPSYSFITPNLCHDGHDSPCVDGEPGGLVSANRFLRSAIPPILHSPAFKDHGLVVINFDEAENDSSACCGEKSGPNTPSPGGIYPGPGGGRTGAVLLSPCIRPGTKTTVAYNHYSLLRSVEDNFGLAHLGYAAEPGLRPFGADVLNRPHCGKRRHRHHGHGHHKHRHHKHRGHRRGHHRRAA